MAISTTATELAEELYHARSQKVASDGTEWIVHPSFHETRKVLGMSFAGTDDTPGEPICDWGVNHIGDWFFKENRKHYKEALMFGLGFPVYAAKKDNRAFLISKKDISSGEIISATAVVEYNPEKEGTFGAKILEGWRSFKTFCLLMTQEDKLPELFANKEHKPECKHFEKKMKKLLSCIQKWHKEEGPKEVHWYIPTVGVSPDFNGKGMGRDLMGKVNELADEVGMVCYLECGTTKRGFYEKMGYRLLSAKQIHDPVDNTRDPVDILLMVRTPEKKEEETQQPTPDRAIIPMQ